jgi:hypothetical protein
VLTGTSDDGRPDLVVLLRFAQRGEEGETQFVAVRVADLWPVEREQED